MSKVWESYHMTTSFVDWISFLSKVAGFGETSSWPTIYNTVILIGHRWNCLWCQRSENMGDTTLSCSTAVFVCSGWMQHSIEASHMGKQTSDGIGQYFHTWNFQATVEFRMVFLVPFLDSHAPPIYIWHGLSRQTVPLYLTDRFDLIMRSTLLTILQHIFFDQFTAIKTHRRVIKAIFLHENL